MVNRKKKLMTISVPEDTQKEFKRNCAYYKINMSRVLSESMETFNQTVENFEKMEEENNERTN